MSYKDRIEMANRKKMEEILPCAGFTAIFLLTLLCGSCDGWDFPTMLKAVELGGMMKLKKNMIANLGEETAELKLRGE